MMMRRVIAADVGAIDRISAMADTDIDASK
jgi:hypothetical protein